MTDPITTRRRVLTAGATGLGASLTASLTACGTDGGSAAVGEAVEPGARGEPGPAARAGADAAPRPRESTGAELGRTSEIPPGGGKVFASRRVVVTQPEAGEFKAYSAVCQHRGCLVSSVTDGSINCACHGSRYDIRDGQVAQGPATTGLPEVNVTVEGGRIRLG